MGFNTDPNEQVPGFAGMISDADPGAKIDSYVSDETSTEIAFGYGVMQGTEHATVDTEPGTPDGVLVPTSSGAKIQGVVVHSHAYDKNTELGTVGIKPGCMVSVMKRGRVLIAVEGSVTKGAQLYCRYTANGGALPGMWRADDDSSKALLVKGVIANQSITGAGIIEAVVDMAIQ